MSNSDNHLLINDLLPDVLNYWRAEKIIPLRVNSDLYNYMDGGAELYISYGFGEALSCTYRKEGQPEVLAEVSEELGEAMDSLDIRQIPESSLYASRGW